MISTIYTDAHPEGIDVEWRECRECCGTGLVQASNRAWLFGFGPHYEDVIYCPECEGEGATIVREIR